MKLGMLLNLLALVLGVFTPYIGFMVSRGSLVLPVIRNQDLTSLTSITTYLSTYTASPISLMSLKSAVSAAS